MFAVVLITKIGLKWIGREKERERERERELVMLAQMEKYWSWELLMPIQRLVRKVDAFFPLRKCFAYYFLLDQIFSWKHRTLAVLNAQWVRDGSLSEHLINVFELRLMTSEVVKLSSESVRGCRWAPSSWLGLVITCVCGLVADTPHAHIDRCAPVVTCTRSRSWTRYW